MNKQQSRQNSTIIDQMSQRDQWDLFFDDYKITAQAKLKYFINERNVKFFEHRERSRIHFYILGKIELTAQEPLNKGHGSYVLANFTLYDVSSGRKN
jgi:hypothetical protein